MTSPRARVVDSVIFESYLYQKDIRSKCILPSIHYGYIFTDTLTICHLCQRIVHENNGGDEGADQETCHSPDEEKDCETLETSRGRPEKLLKFFLSTLHF